jgi:hypothetical protein
MSPGFEPKTERERGEVLSGIFLVNLWWHIHSFPSSLRFTLIFDFKKNGYLVVQ